MSKELAASYKENGKTYKLRELYNIDSIYYDIWVEVYGFRVRPERITDYVDRGEHLVSIKLYLMTKDYIKSKILMFFYNRKHRTHIKLRTLRES